MKVDIHLQPDENERDLSEADAVQMLQNGFAAIARTPVDELAEMWREAKAVAAARRLQLDLFKAPRHRHGRARKTLKDVAHG